MRHPGITAAGNRRSPALVVGRAELGGASGSTPAGMQGTQSAGCIGRYGITAAVFDMHSLRRQRIGCNCSPHLRFIKHRSLLFVCMTLLLPSTVQNQHTCVLFNDTACAPALAKQLAHNHLQTAINR
jgi:hypothetical protein